MEADYSICRDYLNHRFHKHLYTRLKDRSMARNAPCSIHLFTIGWAYCLAPPKASVDVIILGEHVVYHLAKTGVVFPLPTNFWNLNFICVKWYCLSNCHTFCNKPELPRCGWTCAFIKVKLFLVSAEEIVNMHAKMKRKPFIIVWVKIFSWH
jgi:hypothetical protein